MPESGIRRNKLREHLNANLAREINDRDLARAEPVEAAREVHRFADDDRANAELANEAAAIPARREGGDHDFVAIGALAARFPKRIGFGVDGRIIFLDAAIAAAAEKFSFAVEKRGADGDAAFGEAETGFLDGDGEQGWRVKSHL